MPSQRIETSDGISWHIEIFHPGDNATSAESANEYIVLIPSGEGDCQTLTNIARLLSFSGPYNVLTFDMPGFSSTTASPEAHANVTPQLLAKQILGLLDNLSIHRATFFGCSSGGCATLALCALYPARVKCGIIHEVPLHCADVLANMRSMSDEQIVAACRGIFANGFIEHEVNDGLRKWQNLGDEYHSRMVKNYVTWVRGYVNNLEAKAGEIARVPGNLQKRPIFWTVGSLNEGAELGEGRWKTNFEVTRAAGLKVNVERLRCLHFPSVTVPEELVGWIGECVEKVKD